MSGHGNIRRSLRRLFMPSRSGMFSYMADLGILYIEKSLSSIGNFALGCPSSVGHGVDDIVDAKPIGLTRHLGRILRIVGVLPGVAHVHVEIHSHDEAGSFV